MPNLEPDCPYNDQYQGDHSNCPYCLDEDNDQVITRVADAIDNPVEESQSDRDPFRVRRRRGTNDRIFVTATPSSGIDWASLDTSPSTPSHSGFNQVMESIQTTNEQLSSPMFNISATSYEQFQQSGANNTLASQAAQSGALGLQSGLALAQQQSTLSQQNYLHQLALSAATPSRGAVSIPIMTTPAAGMSSNALTSYPSSIANMTITQVYTRNGTGYRVSYDDYEIFTYDSSGQLGTSEPIATDIYSRIIFELIRRTYHGITGER